ncbi:MAG: alpha/beta fold hydrolase, partial [Bacteroidota bacterium]
MGTHFIFIHGFLGNSSMWNFITSNGFRDNYTQNVQIAGHGNTRSVSESSITHFAEDILLQLNIPDQDQIVWIGHSMGGYIALELAEKLHNKTKGIVLFHSTLSADSELKKQDRNRAIDAAREHKNLY